MLFQLGVVTIASPGPFNATDTAEEFGSDFAVKPVVGAAQPREFMGEADGRLTIMGTLFPYRYAAWGMATGLDEVEALPWDDFLREVETAIHLREEFVP